MSRGGKNAAFDPLHDLAGIDRRLARYNRDWLVSVRRIARTDRRARIGSEARPMRHGAASRIIRRKTQNAGACHTPVTMKPLRLRRARKAARMKIAGARRNDVRPESQAKGFGVCA